MAIKIILYIVCILVLSLFYETSSKARRRRKRSNSRNFTPSVWIDNYNPAFIGLFLNILINEFPLSSELTSFWVNL